MAERGLNEASVILSGSRFQPQPYAKDMVLMALLKLCSVALEGLICPYHLCGEQMLKLVICLIMAKYNFIFFLLFSVKMILSPN